MPREKKDGLYNEDRILKGGYVSGPEIGCSGYSQPKGMKPGGDGNSIKGQPAAGGQVPRNGENIIGVGLKNNRYGVDNGGGPEEEIKNYNQSRLIGLRNANR